MEMPSWFDIISFGFKSDEDEDGMLKTVRSLNELITAEVDAGIPADRIVLGGFSQGGAMSILTGLTIERKLGGIACLSGWVPLRHKFEAVRHVRYYSYEVRDKRREQGSWRDDLRRANTPCPERSLVQYR